MVDDDMRDEQILSLQRQLAEAKERERQKWQEDIIADVAAMKVDLVTVKACVERMAPDVKRMAGGEDRPSHDRRLWLLEEWQKTMEQLEQKVTQFRLAYLAIAGLAAIELAKYLFGWK